ncbi:MAG: sn-glycerol-3-phosphate ABC transporter ATP-binding protein UgpC [Legionella sp.]|nr:sn-glycerol-3-phosphate ABC transporter ATP-binding protein UgpC [Legionella sp.]
MATVNLKNVSKYYGLKSVLEDININIEKGEFVVVVGPSGCGKSTLLRLVSGLETVTSGSILINNQCVNKISPAKRDMAMVFQSYALYPHMTVFENMAYALKMRGFKPQFIRNKVTEVAAMLQLSNDLNTKPSALSGGQRQRVAMGRAIVREPSVFLFDEPLSNLDTSLRTTMRHEIKKLHQQLNATCLYVTHDQTEALTMASKVLVLNRGKVEQIGSPQHLYMHPASLFVASFIGHYSINLIPAEIDVTGTKIITKFGLVFPSPVDKTLSFPGRKVIIGMRPEHFLVGQPQKSSAPITGIVATIEDIDHMGADKLIYGVTTVGNVRLSLRMSSDTEIIGNQLSMFPILDKATLFDEESGIRLGGWSHEKEHSH